MSIFKTIVLSLLITSATNATAQMAIGDSLPSITLETSVQAKVQLNELKGKYLLIDFWASWCMPCRVANKKMVKLFNTADSSKLKIVAVSIDNSKSDWLRAIKNDKLEYTQLISPLGFDSEIINKFGVDAIPAKFLFDPSGKLIKIDPTDEFIKKIIKKNEK